MCRVAVWRRHRYMDKWEIISHFSVPGVASSLSVDKKCSYPPGPLPIRHIMVKDRVMHACLEQSCTGHVDRGELIPKKWNNYKFLCLSLCALTAQPAHLSPLSSALSLHMYLHWVAVPLVVCHLTQEDWRMLGFLEFPSLNSGEQLCSRCLSDLLSVLRPSVVLPLPLPQPQWSDLSSCFYCPAPSSSCNSPVGAQVLAKLVFLTRRLL